MIPPGLFHGKALLFIRSAFLVVDQKSACSSPVLKSAPRPLTVPFTDRGGGAFLLRVQHRITRRARPFSLED